MSSAREIWEAALGQLQLQISKPNFETWLKDTVGLSYSHHGFTIGVPNVFVGECLENRFRSLIVKTLMGIIGKEVTVHFSLIPNNKDISPSSALHTDGGLSSPVKAPDFACKLNPKFTFNTFVVGNCNRLAYSAALEVANSMPEHYNPLLICGGTGLGKTHLLQAIGHKTLNNGLKTVYLTAEQFTNEFINSLRRGESESFRQKFKGIKVFLVDDINFLSGKNKIQEYFVQIFSELYYSNTCIAITSDSPPKAIPFLNNRLRSRLESGLVVDLLPPEMETRLAILKTKTEERGLKIHPEVLTFLAEISPGNISELLGALNRVIVYAQTKKIELNRRTAEEALAGIVTKPKNISSMNQVINFVAQYFGLTPEQLRGESRDRKTSLARQIAIYIMREENHYTLSQISQEFNNRDHSTILYHYLKIKEQLKTKSELRRQVSEILQNLKFA